MTILGLEHEFVVRRGGEIVDARDVLTGVDVPGRRLDPGDPFAHRLADGSVLTCDGAEAEVATPPVSLQPGFTAEVLAWADHLTGQLERLADVHVYGVSTHLSVEVPDGLTLEVCGLLARRFAPALMLLGEGPESLGLLVRPRHRRVELGLGFAAGPSLAATTAMAAGAALRCADVAAGRAPVDVLPPRTRPRVEGARARFGWYLDRTAYGVDLYALGRDAPVAVGRWRRRPAGELLRTAWACARQQLVADGLAGDGDLAAADDLVEGRLALPGQRPQARRPSPTGQAPAPSPLGSVVATIERPAFTVTAEVATWDFTVYAVTGARTLHLAVPRADLGGFVTSLAAGALDAALGAALAAPSRHRRLGSYAQAAAGGLFDELGPRADLRAPERAYDGSPA